MINDCAFVGETLTKYLPKEFNVTHIKRTRSLLDKTFGVAWKVWRSKGSLYHVHYLLQDCFLALKFGKKPVVGHAHGSDLREALNSRKWGWIVKHNLKNCEKVLVAQPTILEVAKEYSATSEYFPIPYDPKIFYPKSLSNEKSVKQVLLASPNDFKVKGTDKLLQACSMIRVPFKLKAINYGRDIKKAQILAKKLGLDIEFVAKRIHDEVNRLYWEADVVLGSFGVGQLDTVAIEAMACGRPVVHHILKEHFPQCPLEEFHSIEDAAETISDLLTDEEKAKERCKRQLEYVSAFHRADKLATKLAQIYKKCAL